LWHGLGLIACHAWHKLGWPMPKVTGWAVTMMFVAVGWVVFRAASFTVAGSMALSLAGAGSWAGPLPEIKLLIAAALASALIPSAHQIIDRLRQPHLLLAAGGAMLAIYCLLQIGGGPPVNFIYLQL